MAYSNTGLLFNKHYFKNLKFLDIDNKSNEKIIEENNLKLYDSTLNNTNSYEFTTHKISLLTTYPGLILGTGYAHESTVKGELKLGCFFDHTTGLPVLPGSSVKGVLRSAFEKADGDYIKHLLEDILGLKNVDIQDLEKSIFDDDEKSLYSRDLFFDAFPVGNATKGKFLANDFITPHLEALENPIPIQFLKVLPNIQFQFSFKLVDSGGLTADQKKKLFKQIFLDLGMGAKTNVGYGQFIIDPEQEKKDKLAKAIEDKRIEREKIAIQIAKVEEERKKLIQKAAEDLERRKAINKAKKEAILTDIKNNGLINVLDEAENLKVAKTFIAEYLKNNSNLDSQKEYIKAYVLNSIKKNKKRWKKKEKGDWYSVIKWFDKETANLWFEELIKKIN